MDVTADALCFSSARELAAQIRSREVSAREVMTAFLAQIHALQSRSSTRSWRKLDDESCLALADEADRRARAQGGRAVRCMACRSPSRTWKPPSGFRAPRARRSSRT